VVLLNLTLPDTESLVVLDHIMHERPTPVVIVSSAETQRVEQTMEALKMGAVDFLLTDVPDVVVTSQALHQAMAQKIRAAARVRVVRSLRLRQVCPKGAVAEGPSLLEGGEHNGSHHRSDTLVGVVVIGASTGGPTALRELLGELTSDFAAAIIVVQHMPEAFTAVLAAQLDRYTALSVREAGEGERLHPGVALVAPGDSHLCLSPEGVIQLTKGPPVGGHRPSIDVTMQSVAAVYGARTWGIVLTGMGADGTAGLMAIHTQGGLTFAQDAASCVVDGMPQQARASGIVDHVDTPVQIARRLLFTPWTPRRYKTW
jgi:two-component system chemotaxis response regulator CheB